MDELTGRARSLANLKRYPKGITGNPKGRTPRARQKPEKISAKAIEKAERTIIEDLREAAKRLTDKALKAIEEAFDDPECPRAAQISAAKEIFDRGWGKAKEHVQTDVKLDLEWLLNRGRQLAEQRERERLMIEGDRTV
jgi:hypothetical protein